MGDKYEIGVLFVHGIGEQRKGQTLIDYGEPLCEWFDEWLCINSEGRSGLEIKEVVFPTTDSKACPHFVADIKVKNEDGTEHKGSWLFAESYWAESVPLPKTQKVTLWLMRIIPWVCVSYAGRRIRFEASALSDAYGKGNWLRAIGKLMKILPLLLVGVLLMPLVWVLELLLLAMFVIGSIPIPVVRNYVSMVQKKLSSVIGDSYVFVKSRVRREAVIGEVRANIEWIEKQCENLVIVSHSQGAAVTYLTLEQSIPRKLRGFVTFGSGINKLSHLFSPRFQRNISHVAMSSLTALVAAAGLVIENPRAPSWGTWCIAFIFIGVVLTAVVKTMSEQNTKLKEFGERMFIHKIAWLDLFATSDPVPNGPLFRSKQHFIQSMPVWNERSILRDHTTYQNNSAGFLALVVGTITKQCGIALPILDSTSLEVQRRMRRLLTSAFKMTRLLFIAALFLVLIDDHASLDVGRQIGNWINVICSAVDVQLGEESQDKCWKVSSSLTGTIALLFLYFVVTKFRGPIEDFLSHEWILFMRSTSLGFLFLYFCVFWTALCLSIHLYVAEPLEITRLTVDALYSIHPLLGGDIIPIEEIEYLYSQAMVFGIIMSLVTTLGYMLWAKKMLRPFVLKARKAD